MLTMEDIRARYPQPSVGSLLSAPLAPDRYCVGGACVFAAGSPCQGSRAFPQEADLANALRQLHPGLTYAQAIHVAYGIIAANDAGRFDDAWNLVAHALMNDGNQHE